MLVIRDPDQAATLLQPERMRLLEALGEPDSAAGLARRFALPRQRLNYHLKELERSGLVELVEERRKGNCVERVLKATARAYTISSEVLGGLAGAPPVVDRLSATYLVAVASRAVQELGGLIARATVARKRLATLTLDTEIHFASAGARAEFADELSAAVARLAAKYHAPAAAGGRTFRLIASAYPKPSDPSSATARREETRR
jgi:DNA-binding transcriptional ArsR family regulator